MGSGTDGGTDGTGVRDGVRGAAEDLLVAALASSAPFLRLQSLGSGLGVSNRLGLSKRGGGGRVVEVESARSVGDGSIGI